MRTSTKFLQCSTCDGRGYIDDPRYRGSEMRRTRIKADRTLSQVAVAMGISKGYLSDLELGRRSWNEGLIDEYKKALR